MSTLYTSSADRALLDQIAGGKLASGETVFPREDPTAALTQSSQTMRFTFFTAQKTEPITQIRMWVGNTAASGGTLARIGIYTVDAVGDITLLVATTNHASLWNSANVAHTEALASTWNKIAGTRYAVGDLFVGTTAPNWVGKTWASGVNAALLSELPRVAAALTGQSDLPTGATQAGLADSGYQIQHKLVP